MGAREAGKARKARKAEEAYGSNECAMIAVLYPELLQLQCYYTVDNTLRLQRIIIIEFLKSIYYAHKVQRLKSRRL